MHSSVSHGVDTHRRFHDQRYWWVKLLGAAQVEALLDRIGDAPPVMDYVAAQLERLGYCWAYRVLQTAGS